MRGSPAPIFLAAAGCLALGSKGFVVGPPGGVGTQSNRRLRRGSSASNDGAGAARLSVAVITRRERSAPGAAVATVAMSLDNQGNAAKFESARSVMGGGGGSGTGATPEDLLRQMSIPDLAQRLDQAESTYGQVHPQVAAALIPLSQALFANGDLGPARETCTRALRILQSAFGQTPRVETAECLHTLAMIQQCESPEIGDKALGSQNMALELAMRVCGSESIEVAAYARCLAQMSEHYSQFLSPGLPRPFYMPNPVPLYRQTLEILEKIVGKDHPEVASSLDDLASALLFWRDDKTSDIKAGSLLPEAEMLAKRSLSISAAALGPDHPTTAGREQNLGMVKRALGREADARQHFQRALAIREKALGPGHPDTKSSRALVEEGDDASVAP